MSLELVLSAGVAVAGGGVARAAIGAAALRKAREQVAGDCEVIRRRHQHVRELPLRYRDTNDALLRTIVASCEARRDIIAKADAVALPAAGGVHYIPEFESRVEQAGVSFFAILRSSYLLKVGTLAVGQVADRFDENLGILRHARHHLSAVEQQIIDLLDQVGAINFAETALEIIPEVVRLWSETAADAAVNGMSDFLHATSTVFHVPGLISGICAAIQELEFLAEDGVSLGEAFVDGVVPTAIQMTFTKIGVMLDSSCGWMSLGFFTITCSWLGKLLGNELLVARLQEQIDIVNSHVARIRARQRDALSAIGGATDDLIEAFRRTVGTCPDIGDELVLRSYVAELLEAYQGGLVEAGTAAARHVATLVAALPERTWLDIILGIDRPLEMANALWEIQRELESRHLGVANRFAAQSEVHTEHAIRVLQREHIFMNCATRRALARQDRVLVEVARDYARSLTAWEEKCRVVWEEGVTHVREVTRREHALTRVLVTDAMADIEAARRRIAILRRRLGQRPGSAPI